MNNKTALIILDGWGYGSKDDSDGIHISKTPFFDSLVKKHPNACLKTFGEDVGLPTGQMGNSEVGHLNIGAGRVVNQDLLRINNAIADKSFFSNAELLKSIEIAHKNKSSIHLMGLVSEGGVHSSIDHLLALCSLLEKDFKGKVYIHGFTDGRDCSPKSGINAFQKLENYILNTNIQISSIIGRYYAMDRDQRWERIKKAYDLLLYAKGTIAINSQTAFHKNYDKGITDEFLEPTKINNLNGTIKKNDVVICFNFRTDRCRQITTALTQKSFPEFKMTSQNLSYFTMTNYDRSFKNINVIYDKENITNTLGEIISLNNKKQLRIAETEKYPHVTYFFSGGRENEFKGESRIVVPSPKVATYDLKPEMSAYNVTEQAINFIEKELPDFICLNFANPDMVGHTGITKAIIKACEAVDKCLERIISCLQSHNYSSIVIADHGNADKMKNKDGSIHTAHTLNMVPIIVINKDVITIKNGRLADVAPTILKLMNLDKPLEMTGISLV